MPCNSDYMEPTRAEENSRETAKLLLYVYKKLGRQPYPIYLVEAANTRYGNPSKLNDMVVELCRVLRSIRKDDFERIVYNARSKESRALADWWEDHEAADLARVTDDIQILESEIKNLKAEIKQRSSELQAAKKELKRLTSGH